ncbi:PEP/pyruvate-binding domain-containing protein [Salidesulfovibrio onnuriiensis]|uniref:PEP/pyruvate-binding domain-containing protein n=1 Tax=Salidesulfovibrio onnuriiensis TaxID=2583823 RepID=UPI0011C9BF8A|nr:PEP/pyruvate-binding domain-containing protein [Salidesulfovibrio onnuriiensis]
MGFRDWLPFFKRKEETEQNAEDFRAMLASRHHHFRQLLSADSENHEIFTDIEEALRGERVYGMSFVRAACTRASAATFRMIQHLDKLAPGKYARLYEVFDEIRKEIEPHIAHKEFERGGPLVLDIADITREHTDLCGAKMASLGEAGKQLGLRVPSGFVITAEAYRRFMEQDDLRGSIERIFQSLGKEDRDALYQATSRVMQQIMNTPLPHDLEREILAAHARLKEAKGPDVRVALRSSALGEDTERTTFAGQYRSILNVDRENLLDAYREVVASKYSVQALTYRLNRGIRHEDVAMCVGCMSMVDARSGGVAYSHSPVDPHDDSVTIYSVWGLPRAVVDGATETDIFTLSRSPLEVTDASVAHKTEKYVCLPGEGTCAVENEDNAGQPSLSDEEALEIAKAALAIETYFGLPQDVEWAVTRDGGFRLLQCRPLPRSDAEEGVRADRKGIGNLPTPVMQGGINASTGVGFGPVFKVSKDADALQFPEGAVLVMPHALPRRAALLGRASAVVSERGGAAGHLANVAREFGVPALFSLRGAMEILEDGQELTVDADGQALYAGKVDALLQLERPRPNPMRGSPVRASLRNAARHIIRLRLLDPDSAEFRPRYCKTFHDIMRFCHETAVREMFDFGMSQDYRNSPSRQLICDVPKQFWVLNLEDGFSPEGEQRGDACVRLEQVESIPMRSLWAGMTAVPWEGPPPVNARGFMSVMFEATMNPNLTAARASDFVMKNYFIISRNYCSLQSRFGFHFCNVESLVGDRPSENYARFNFKGGPPTWNGASCGPSSCRKSWRPTTSGSRCARTTCGRGWRDSAVPP